MLYQGIGLASVTEIPNYRGFNKIDVCFSLPYRSLGRLARGLHNHKKPGLFPSNMWFLTYGSEWLLWSPVSHPHPSQKEGRVWKEKIYPFPLRPGSEICHNTPAHNLPSKQTPRGHLALREAGKCSLLLGSHMPS